MDVHDDWKNTVEARPGGKLVRLQPVGADEQLKVTSYEVPQVITEDRPRTMTNVDERVPLTWQQWGFRNCGQVTAEQ